MSNTTSHHSLTFDHMEDGAYRNAKGLSKSLLTHFLKSPAHYQQALLDKHEPTPAMQFGTAFHASLLLSDPTTAFAVKRKVDGRTKEGKEYNQRFEMENVGKAIIDEEQEKMIHSCIASILEHPFAGQLHSGCDKKEFSVFGSYSGKSAQPVLLKGRMDAYDSTNGFIIDYKTCEDASPTGFRKAVWNFRYDLQVVQYAWLIKNAGLKFTNFYFIAVEKAPPFASAVYCIEEASIKRSVETWENAMFEFSQCEASSIWPAYSATPVAIQL